MERSWQRPVSNRRLVSPLEPVTSAPAARHVPRAHTEGHLLAVVSLRSQQKAEAGSGCDEAKMDWNFATFEFHESGVVLI